MNQRIKELIEQAGFEEKDGHISIQGVYMFNTNRMEKFAELIVKECSDVVRHIDCQGGGNLGDVITKKVLKNLD